MSSIAAKTKRKSRTRLSNLLVFFGLGMILASLAIFTLTFYPVLREEAKYTATQITRTTATNLSPVDTDFGIVIPKIEANAKVVPNVDPYNEREYQWQLTHGVAHAKGSALPYQNGNVFIFAHSAGNFYEANRFNAVFYLLTKLEAGDEVDLYYKGTKYQYKVFDKKLVDASAVQYLSGQSPEKTLTLMTCWPPGTTLKRLIVVAKPAS